jgi:elongation factor G
VDQVPTDRIRNVALVGHGGSGKTSLAEALLYEAGAIARLGRVEDGSTVSDAEPEEQAHGQSLSLSVTPFEWNGHKINLIDTPGYADFEGEARTAMTVADLAVFVISAVDGVQGQTIALWQVAADLGLPRMVFVNKLDRERSSFERTLEEIRAEFGAGVAPLELPIGQEAAFCGVADLLTDTAFTYDLDPARPPGTAARHAGQIPDEMEALEHQVHDNLVEGIVVADDELLERFLDGETPALDQLEHTLALGLDAATVFPVVCGSAIARVGIDRLADLLCEIGPSPLERPPTQVEAGSTTVEIEPDAAGPPLAWVFKTVTDRHVGQISLLKVLSGTLRSDEHLVNPRSGRDERLHGLFALRGREHLDQPVAAAGDLAAVAKLASTVTGDTLAPKGTPVRVPRLDPPEPVLAVAVVARTQTDDDKLATALHRLVEEDPSLVVERNDETHQTVLAGMGETHLQVTLERLARKFGVAVTQEEVRIAYRETVLGAASAEGKYKKQSGGHGQFGVAEVQIEPLERGAGFEFVDRIVGGAIPRQFIPAVEKGIIEAMAAGGVFGYPVVDVRAACTDGKYHPVDSSEMSFKMAGRLAFREALAQADPIILEPISQLEVTVPAELQGDVMGDLHARRARVQGTEATGRGDQVIVALVPTAELRRYAVDLRSRTSGRGRFRAHHDHYDALPAHLVATVAPGAARNAAVGAQAGSSV